MSRYFICILASFSYSFCYVLFKFYYIFIGFSARFIFSDSTLSCCVLIISGIFWLKLESFGKSLIQRQRKDYRCCQDLTSMHSKEHF